LQERYDGFIKTTLGSTILRDKNLVEFVRKGIPDKHRGTSSPLLFIYLFNLFIYLFIYLIYLFIVVSKVHIVQYLLLGRLWQALSGSIPYSLACNICYTELCDKYFDKPSVARTDIEKVCRGYGLFWTRF
jgi:hypothetical protein